MTPSTKLRVVVATPLSEENEALELIHGTRGGSRVALWLSTAQFTNPQEEDFNGRAMVRYELRGVPDPAGTGNDELRLVASF